MAPPPPHPWAGKSGEGPPIAPPNWRWRAGNRISDMYFYSPSGKQFRSRPELASYLKNLDNPPDARLFCWRVTSEVLKNGYMPQGDVVRTKPDPKRKRQSPVCGKKKIKTESAKPFLQPPSSYGQPSSFAGQPTPVESAALFAPGSNFPERVTTLTSVEHGHVNGRDRKKGKGVRISLPRSFKSILAGRSSFKWLYDSDTLEKFLGEARSLKYESAAETNELRKVLLERHLDMSNICKYPNSAIRVFVRLLRNEEAPVSMGKVELASLCVHWKCKKRHYWCFLEIGRVNAPPTKCSKVEDIKRGAVRGPSKGSVSHVVEGRSSHHQYVANGRGRGNEHDWLIPPEITSNLDFGLPDGSGRVAEEWASPAEPTGKLDPRGTLTFGNESEVSTSSEPRGLDIAITRRSDGVVGTWREEVETPSLVPAANLNDGDGVINAPASESVLEALGGTLRGEAGLRSEAPALRLDGGTTAVSHENDTIPQGMMQTEREPISEGIPNLRHGDNPSVSWNNASLSEPGNALSQMEAKTLSGEPAFSGSYMAEFKAAGDIARRAEALEVMLTKNPDSFTASEPASDLYGESIIVITGFKSSKSKGTGRRFHVNEAEMDKARQFNRGNCATDGCSFGCKLERASTFNNGSRRIDTDQTSVLASGAVDGELYRKRDPEPASSLKVEGLTTCFLGRIKSELIESASLRDDDKMSEGPGSNFKFLGLGTITHGPENRSKTVQGTVQRQQQSMLEDLASTLNDEGGISLEDVSETLFSSNANERCHVVTNPENPNVPLHFDDAALTLKNYALVLPATVEQGPLGPYDDDGSPTLNDTPLTSSILECLIEEPDEGIMDQQLTDGTHEGNHMSTAKHFSAGRDSFACRCKICSSDFLFCRGCMCSFCRRSLQQGDDWMVVKCICNHVCHIDCALAANAAGIVEELGLDGELLCPSCSRKVDLWPFFQKRFDLMSSLIEVAHLNLKGLEKLLLQAVQLLEGTEKSRYKPLEGLVVESHELMRRFPFLVLIQQLLRSGQDELLIPCSDPDHKSWDGRLSASAPPEQIELLKKEHLARESMDVAKNERLLMEQAVDKVLRAYEDALKKQREAKIIPRPLYGEPNRLKARVNPAVTEEMLVLQQAKVDQELLKLRDMSKFEAGHFLTFSALDANAGAWLECLKTQRVIVELAQAELQRLVILNVQGMAI